jgi:hypothetical protein
VRARIGGPALASALILGALPALAGPFDLEGTQPHDLDAQNPPEDVESKCSACHAGSVDDDGKHFRPWDSWSGTMMANAARDPLFLAALTVAEQDVPGAGAYCLRCHTPQAFVRGDVTDGFGAALGDDDKQGVACEACHRSTDPSVGLGTNPPVDPSGPYAGNAQLFWDPGVQKHGPYADADSPAHTTLADPFTSSSRLCGQCHEVSNPAVHQRDAQGMDTGRPFPLDTTFTEWSSSSYASGSGKKECIDCHMPAAAGSLTLSTFPTTKTRDNPRMHVFVGGNAWGIDAVQASQPTLATTRKLAFNEARAAAVAMLEGAVKVEVTKAPASVDPGQPFDVTVRVTNNAGHKFPTGYADGRRAFLRIELVDAQGAAQVVTGKYDDTAHALVDDPQLHVYEAVHEEKQGAGAGTAWHIARSNTVVKDTRIPPQGFIPGPTTAIIGADYGDGMGGVHAYDEGTFHLAAPGGAGGGKLTVRATVLYQSTVKELVDELVKANVTDGRGSTLQQVFGMTGYAAPLAIGSAEVSVALSGESGAGGGGGGGAGGGAGGGRGGGGGGGGGGRRGWRGGEFGRVWVLGAG